MATKTITTFHPTGSTDVYNFRASYGPKSVGDTNTPIYLNAQGQFVPGTGMAQLEADLQYILYGTTTGTWPDIYAIIERGPQFPVKTFIKTQTDGTKQELYLGVPSIIWEAISSQDLEMNNVFEIVYLRLNTTWVRKGNSGNRQTVQKTRKWHRIQKGNGSVWHNDEPGADLIKFDFSQPGQPDFERDGFSYFMLIMRYDRNGGGDERWDETDIRSVASLPTDSGGNPCYPTGYFDINGDVPIARILDHENAGLSLFMDGEQRSGVAKIRFMRGTDPGWTSC